MRTKKKKRLRPQTKSGHVKFRATAVADCSHIAEYGERDGDLQGALDSPPGGWSHGLGLRTVAARLTLFVFFPKYHQMCGSCQGQRSRAPFGKMRKSKTTEEQLFFFPLLLLLFINAKKRARASHPPIVHEVGFCSCEPLPGSN